MELQGTPSDAVPAVLATGRTEARYAFFSLSARDPEGRDAEYIAWHSLDHRPEQYRLSGLRGSLRLVSTPACRAARAASAAAFDAVDHVMAYLFTGADQVAAFAELGGSLAEAGRMPLLLRQVGHLTGDLAETWAAPGAKAGADVIPWRPCTGAYLVIERPGERHAFAPPAEIPGLAGTWQYDGTVAPAPFRTDARGLTIAVHYLDEDPVACAGPLGEHLRSHWRETGAEGLLAAPFFAPVPFVWDRYLPGPA